MAQGGPRAAVPLQRGLARILLASGDRPAAIEAYRGILNVEPDGASDRVALAEIYAVDDPQRAIGELRKVLDRDIHHAPAYRLLASFYSRTGDTERANRVLTALDLLGFAEDADRATMSGSRRPGSARRCAASSTTTPRAPPADHAGRARAARRGVRRARRGAVVGGRPAVARPEPAARRRRRRSPAGRDRGRGRRAVPDRGRGLHRREGPRPGRGDRVPAPDARGRSLADHRVRPDRCGSCSATRSRRSAAATPPCSSSAPASAASSATCCARCCPPSPGSPAPPPTCSAAPAREAQKVIERHSPGSATSTRGPGSTACSRAPSARASSRATISTPRSGRWPCSRARSWPATDATVALGSVLGGPDLVRYYLSDNYQQIRELVDQLSYGIR